MVGRAVPTCIDTETGAGALAPARTPDMISEASLLEWETSVIDPPRRQRAERVDVQRTREAQKLVLPVNRQIGVWQAQAARLVAFGSKLRTTGGFEPRLKAEAEDLAHAIERQRQALLDEASALPPEIANHSRLLDTVRALDSVHQSATKAVELLSPGGGTTVPH